MVIKSVLSDEIEFVSYDGGYPNLCSGLLKIKVKGTIYEFHPYKRCQKLDIKPEFWRSGGGLDDDYHPYHGEWIIDISKLPEELQQYAFEIDRLFNENVEYGCCGGCD